MEGVFTQNKLRTYFKQCYNWQGFLKIACLKTNEIDLVVKSCFKYAMISGKVAYY